MKRHYLFSIFLILLLLAAAGIALLMPGGKGTPKAEPTPVSMEETASPPAETAPAPSPEQTEEPTPEPPEETPEETPEATPEPTEEPTPEPTPEFPLPEGYTALNLSSSAILAETEDMGQEYLDKIIFLGDSTTYGMKYYGMLSGGKDTLQVWTPTSGTLTLSYQSFAAILYPDDGTEITIREAVEKKKPEMMVITLGVNGVSFMEREDFLREYTDLVTDIMELSPDTKVIIQSIFPVSADYEYIGSINNAKITRANSWLLEVAENTGARYLNTISVLMDETGFLPSAYNNGDGLHLNADSFAIVLNYIRTHGWV